MLQTLKRQFDREEEGFTLIELMVVVLIIAILLAIAIPTFLGARDKANARASQSNVRNGLTAEQSYFTDNQVFGAAAAVQGTEPNITFQATAATTKGGNVVTVNPITPAGGSATQVLLQAYANDGNCYSLFQDNGTGTTAGTQYQVTAGACSTSLGLPSAAPASGSKASVGGGWAAAW